MRVRIEDGKDKRKIETDFALVTTYSKEGVIETDFLGFEGSPDAFTAQALRDHAALLVTNANILDFKE